MLCSMKAYEEIAEFIAGTRPEAVAAFKASPEVKDRVAELLRREKAGAITSEEKSELDHFATLEHVMSLAKARAHQLLAHGR